MAIPYERIIRKINKETSKGNRISWKIGSSEMDYVEHIWFTYTSIENQNIQECSLYFDRKCMERTSAYDFEDKKERHTEGQFDTFNQEEEGKCFCIYLPVSRFDKETCSCYYFHKSRINNTKTITKNKEYTDDDLLYNYYHCYYMNIRRDYVFEIHPDTEYTLKMKTPLKDIECYVQYIQLPEPYHQQRLESIYQKLLSEHRKLLYECFEEFDIYCSPPTRLLKLGGIEFQKHMDEYDSLFL